MENLFFLSLLGKGAYLKLYLPKIALTVFANIKTLYTSLEKSCSVPLAIIIH